MVGEEAAAVVAVKGACMEGQAEGAGGSTHMPRVTRGSALSPWGGPQPPLLPGPHALQGCTRTGEAPLVAGQRAKITDLDFQQIPRLGGGALGIAHPDGAGQVVHLCKVHLRGRVG